jgi:hypothetical protein
MLKISKEFSSIGRRVRTILLRFQVHFVLVLQCYAVGYGSRSVARHRTKLGMLNMPNKISVQSKLGMQYAGQVGYHAAEPHANGRTDRQFYAFRSRDMVWSTSVG